MEKEATDNVTDMEKEVMAKGADARQAERGEHEHSFMTEGRQEVVTIDDDKYRENGKGESKQRRE